MKAVETVSDYKDTKFKSNSQLSDGGQQTQEPFARQDPNAGANTNNSSSKSKEDEVTDVDFEEVK